MAVIHRCPGVEHYGHGRHGTTVHAAGCCARFALMSDERRAATGLIIPVRTEPDEPRPVPPQPETITVPGLIELVAGLQRDAAEYPDAVFEETIAWVEITPEYDLNQVLALIDLGRPYGLVAGWRRVLNSPKEST